MAKESKKPEPKKDAKPAAAETKAVLVCPRCGVSLGTTKYEGMAVDFCDACWGYWIGLHQFEAILAAKDEVFSSSEQAGASGAKAHPNDGKPLLCPRCRKGMAKLPIEERGRVAFFLDYCKDHGLWLDTGEIKRAQILDEKTGAVRKALRASFSRTAGE